MSTILRLSCRCGATGGEVRDYAPDRANRVICYCTDCRAFVQWLDRADLLDTRGGSDIVQVAPASLRIERGSEHLRCARLTDRGLYRWYAGCCRQPVGNTVAASWSPFVGLVTGLVDPGEGRSLDEVLGPSSGGVHGRRAIGGKPPGAAEVVTARQVARGLGAMLGHVLWGRTRPYPFVDRNGMPIGPVDVLTADERRR